MQCHCDLKEISPSHYPSFLFGHFPEVEYCEHSKNLVNAKVTYNTLGSSGLSSNELEDVTYNATNNPMRSHQRTHEIASRESGPMVSLPRRVPHDCWKILQTNSTICHLPKDEFPTFCVPPSVDTIQVERWHSDGGER